MTHRITYKGKNTREYIKKYTLYEECVSTLHDITRQKTRNREEVVITRRRRSTPSSRMETGYVSARFLSPAMSFPATGNVGSLDTTHRWARPFSNRVDPCTGHLTPPRSVQVADKRGVLPSRANPCGDTRCLSRKPPRQTLESICGLSRRRRTRIFLPFF